MQHILQNISKVISERLNKVLSDLIHESQGAFLKHRGACQIVLAGLELIHQIVNSTKSKSHMENIAIKLDLSEAFDRVEWSYLLYLMQRHNFPSHFIHFISQCLTNTKIAIHYNKTRTLYFAPTKDLR